MTATQPSGHNGGDTRRPVVYCLLPADLASKLHDHLRDHFREQRIEVVVEGRRHERRQRDERRITEGKTPPTADRRQIRSAAGRRAGERRAALVPLDTPPALPRRARAHADRLTFVERLEPSTQHAEDLDTARLIGRIQSGDRAGFSVLYTRYFDRVYAYLRVALRDTDDAEDVVQQVFLKVFENLSTYEARRQPFRAWLFRIVRNQTIDRLRRTDRMIYQDPNDIDRTREAEATDPDPLAQIDWLTDRDLMLFVERLPLAQRQVLVLTYILDLPSPEIAKILGRSDDDVRLTRSRALRMLRSRLEAVGHRAASRGGTRPAPSYRRIRQLGVLRSRRFALH